MKVTSVFIEFQKMNETEKFDLLRVILAVPFFSSVTINTLFLEKTQSNAFFFAYGKGTTVEEWCLKGNAVYQSMQTLFCPSE